MGHRVDVGGVSRATALAFVVAVALGAAGTPGGPAAAGFVLVVGGDRFNGVGGLVGAIAAGAVVGVVLGWLVAAATEVVAVAPVLAAGLGLAVGGGLGSLVWLLAIDDEEPDTGETVTVDMDDEEQGPEPEPVDLFEASPDPILFYAETADGPVVRAVNPAFAETFGVSSEALDGTPLRGGVLVSERAEAVVAAADGSDPFDEVLPCETEDGPRRMRIRIAATGRDRTDGYVLYTPEPGD